MSRQSYRPPVPPKDDMHQPQVDAAGQPRLATAHRPAPVNVGNRAPGVSFANRAANDPRFVTQAKEYGHGGKSLAKRLKGQGKPDASSPGQEAYQPSDGLIDNVSSSFSRWREARIEAQNARREVELKASISSPVLVNGEMTPSGQKRQRNRLGSSEEDKRWVRMMERSGKLKAQKGSFSPGEKVSQSRKLSFEKVSAAFRGKLRAGGTRKGSAVDPNRPSTSTTPADNKNSPAQEAFRPATATAGGPTHAAADRTTQWGDFMVNTPFFDKFKHGLHVGRDKRDSDQSFYCAGVDEGGPFSPLGSPYAAQFSPAQAQASPPERRTPAVRWADVDYTRASVIAHRSPDAVGPMSGRLETPFSEHSGMYAEQFSYPHDEPFDRMEGPSGGSGPANVYSIKRKPVASARTQAQAQESLAVPEVSLDNSRSSDDPFRYEDLIRDLESPSPAPRISPVKKISPIRISGIFEWAEDQPAQQPQPQQDWTVDSPVLPEEQGAQDWNGRLSLLSPSPPPPSSSSSSLSSLSLMSSTSAAADVDFGSDVEYLDFDGLPARASPGGSGTGDFGFEFGLDGARDYHGGSDDCDERVCSDDCDDRDRVRSDDGRYGPQMSARYYPGRDGSDMPPVSPMPDERCVSRGSGYVVGASREKYRSWRADYF